MNQEKIGSFIAACRKEKGVTQSQIAEKFGVSNAAVSKWENWKSLPDASIMIELCDLLGITVNELLIGEKISMEEYKEKEEENLSELQDRLNKLKKSMIISNAFLVIIAIMCAFSVPWALIFVIFVIAFRDYYLIKDMKSVRLLIEKSKSKAAAINQ